jgi:hypothetical protein
MNGSGEDVPKYCGQESRRLAPRLDFRLKFFQVTLSGLEVVGIARLPRQLALMPNASEILPCFRPLEERVYLRELLPGRGGGHQFRAVFHVHKKTVSAWFTSQFAGLAQW